MQTEPAADLRGRVQSLIAGLAGADGFDPARPLAESGFDSLGYAELALAVEEELGVPLAEADVGRLETVEDIVRQIERLRPQRRSARIPRGIGRHQDRVERIASPLLTRWYRVEYTGQEHIPVRGPAIVCANHNSLLDIPFLAMAVPREIWFMAKAELFRGPGAGLFNALGGFPVRRQLNDLRAVDTALAVLDRGRLLGMFPEGTRSPLELLPFLTGAAWIALVKGVPLVPAAITGAAESMPRGSRIPKRTPIAVRFGRPLFVEQEREPRWRAARAGELTVELRERVEALIHSER